MIQGVCVFVCAICEFKREMTFISNDKSLSYIYLHISEDKPTDKQLPEAKSLCSISHTGKFAPLCPSSCMTHRTLAMVGLCHMK